MSMLKIRRFFTLVTLVFLVSACTSKEEQIAKAIEKQAQATEQSLKQLEQAMADNRIRNATVLTSYAESIGNIKPELSALAKELAKDATTEGAMYKNLFLRYEEAKSNPTAFVNWQERINELQAISEGAQVSLFNDALSDPINVLADLSGGELGRVNAMSREAEIRANNVENAGPGSQLVGNPSYGSWQTDSSGMSFWAWYGMYSMFNNVFGYNHYYYNSWGRNRGYSYYNDYGRKRYSSPKQRLKQDQLYNKTKKSFSARGKSFSGPYSKRRVGSSSLSRSSHTATKRSSFAKKSSFSSGGGSMRNSSSRTSRGIRRGK